MRCPALLRSGWLLLVCGALVAQELSVEAVVDRAAIRENESFNYTVRAEGSVRGEPTVAGLSDNFDILNRSTSTRIQIINGRTEQVAEWVYQLMPRAAGSFVIPPAQIAGVASNAVEVEVLAGLPAGDDLADIFMEVEADPQNAYVQSQIIFTLRLFVGIGTGRATLSAPSIEGVEAIIERLGEDANYSTTRGGRSYVVRERSYAVFAQQPGNLTIGPAVFEVMVIPNRGFSRVQRYSSDAVDIEILPAVAPPPEYPQAVWLPARRVALTESWSEESDTLEMGVPRTRALTIEADGLLETQLPDLEIAQADGVRQYSDQPELERTPGPAGLTVRKTDRFAVIAQRAGEVELPAIELPWWNVDARQWETARIAPQSLSVLPSSEDVAPAAENPIPNEAEVQTMVEYSATPWWVAGFLGLGWFATAAAWWYTARAGARQARSASGQLRGNERTAMSDLRRACAASEPHAARDALLAWAGHTREFRDCTSLGALAEELPEEAATAIRDLERHLYSAHAAQWSGAPLAGCIATLRSAKERKDKGTSDPLPSLYN